MNDLEKCLEFSIFADDTNITIASDDVVTLIEDAHQELSNLSEWMRVNKLSPNPKKAEVMIVEHPLTAKSIDLPEVLKLNNCDIKRVDKAKSLRVIINEKLNWHEQFKRTKSKISGGPAAQKNLKIVISQSQLCNVIWGSLSETKIAVLQRLQDRAYSIITDARIKYSWSASWLNVENLFRYDRNVMIYKIMNRLCPENPWDKYQLRSFHSTYNMRHCKDLQIPRYKTQFAKKGFHYSALKCWNDTLAENSSTTYIRSLQATT